MTLTPGPDLPENPENKESHTGHGRRRTLVTVLVVVLLVAAAAGAWVSAMKVTRAIEERASSAVHLALSDEAPWASVKTSGLQVILSGTAPDEGARLRVITAASDAVGPGRIRDEIEVAPQSAVAAPDFRMELLRNSSGVSMIGLVPKESDPAALAAALRSSRDVANVTDLLESADYPLPEGWEPALDFAMSAVLKLPQARISVAPAQVTVAALAESSAGRDRLKKSLADAAPPGVELVLDIKAPRPVIAPFTLTFTRDGEDATLEACSADSEAAREKILAAAKAAGVDKGLDCRLGLGAPTALWADAAVPAIDAIGRLGAGTVTLSNSEIMLEVPDTVSQDRFHEVVAGLRKALPDSFRLSAERVEQMHGLAGFTAIEDETGRLVLHGTVPDERMREAVESLARSRFARVETMLSVDPQVPEGWTLRVIAALDAVAGLEAASAEVTPDLIRLEGVSGDRAAAQTAAAVLTRRLGAGARYAFAIRYDPRLDPALNLPTGEECAARANDALALSEIGFDPGRTHFAGDVAPALEQLGAALKGCEDFQLEIGGHTDAQGSKEGNRVLSQQRAEAVQTALAEIGVDTANLSTTGYGASQPLEDNDTEAGREANRRIEFKLLSDEPVTHDGPSESVPPITGVTGGPTPPLLPSALAAAGQSGASPGQDGAGTEATTGPSAKEASGSPALPENAVDPAVAALVDAVRGYGLDGALALVPPQIAPAFARSGGAEALDFGIMPHSELGFAAAAEEGYSRKERDADPAAAPLQGM